MLDYIINKKILLIIFFNIKYYCINLCHEYFLCIIYILKKNDTSFAKQRGRRIPFWTNRGKLERLDEILID